jgi:hypothetical protein
MDTLELSLQALLAKGANLRKVDLGFFITVVISFSPTTRALDSVIICKGTTVAGTAGVTNLVPLPIVQISRVDTTLK